jgi:ABC-2 type transport system ATP-binding protein
MIKIRNLTKKFDQFKAVTDLNFDVSEGEVLGFLGPNGAGKSTTMKVITGFLSPSSGVVEIDGYDIVEDSIKAKALVGYLPEGAPCYEDMSVSEFLTFIAEIRGFRNEDVMTRVQHVLELVDLQSVCRQSIGTLSKGFKRRVGLAQAILHDPKVLILDEPTDGLDPNQKHHVRDLIKNLAKDKIVIISTHILEEVTAVCTRAIIINAGEIVADGTPSELESKSRYHHSVVVTFSKAYNAQDDLFELSDHVTVEQNGSASLTILSNSRSPIFTKISEIARSKKWPVSEFHVNRGQLEDVFRIVTGKTTEGDR